MIDNAFDSLFATLGLPTPLKEEKTKGGQVENERKAKIKTEAFSAISLPRQKQKFGRKKNEYKNCLILP